MKCYYVHQSSNNTTISGTVIVISARCIPDNRPNTTNNDVNQIYHSTSTGYNNDNNKYSFMGYVFSKISIYYNMEELINA